MRIVIDRDGVPVLSAGAEPSRLTLACDLRQDAPELDAAMPLVLSRVGLERSPMDIRRPFDLDWLRALIWPEHLTRLARFDQALAVMRSHPVPIQPGDALETLPAALKGLSPDGAVVVFHSHVTYQFSAQMRDRLDHILTVAGRERALWRVSIEYADGVYPIELRHYGSDAQARLWRLGLGDPHGRWLAWAASGAAG